jgi:hypothetical protein
VEDPIVDRAERGRQRERSERGADQAVQAQGRVRALQHLRRHHDRHRRASHPCVHGWRVHRVLLQNVSDFSLVVAVVWEI